jgi:glycosyltransferase involved in cell wall biosynthesis
MSAPAVSVLMPVYNGERFIREAVASVLGQTWRDLELVVVDDGSSDRSLDIVEAFRDPRIRNVSIGRSGISAALNAGLARCRAPFVARLDSDDVMEPRRLERQLDFLRARPRLGGCASYYWIIDEAGIVKGFQDPSLLSLEDVDLQLRSGGRLIYAHPTIMFRREAVLDVGGYDSAFDGSEDVELILRMYEAGWPMLVQPERLTRFRVHPGSISAQRARTQYFLNETTFGNFRRRRLGLAPLSIEACIREANANPLRRLATEARIASYELQRRRLELDLKGRPVSATAALFSAAILNPQAVAGALVRSGVRSWRRIKAETAEP